MRIGKKSIVIIIWVLSAVSFSLVALASIDAPHNESNNVSCGSCHGQGLLQSFWGGSGIYSTFDELCLSCHKASSGPYTSTNAPFEKTHSSDNTSEQYGTWTWECRNCHDPHYQRQKNYKNTDANDFFLATGTITGCVDNEDGTSTLTYSSITYKTGWIATKLLEKTSECRRAIIFPNLGKLGFSYPVIGIDEGLQEITVSGNATTVYQYILPPTNFAMIYGQYVKESINNRQVKLFNRKDAYSCADGDTTYNGVCEICHTQTLYHRNNGTGGLHYPAVRCSICHVHTNGFANSDHTGGSGSDCEDCHGHDDGWAGGSYFGTMGSHSTHTENDSDDVKGPFIDCDTCHDIYNYPYFKSGTDGNADGKYDLSETDVCDICHSPSGSYDGVNDASIGAKNNWSVGVYESPTLKAGKEKWCAGCHDEEPANSKADDTGIDAPNVIGDEDAAIQYGTGYGFYKTGHGLSTGSYPASGSQAANSNCSDCHDAAFGHIDHDSRTYAADQKNYQEGYRLKYSMDIPRIDTGWPVSDFELCAQCHDIDPFIQRTNLTSNLRNVQASGTSTGLTETVLTDTSKSWSINEFLYDGTVLIPDIEKPWNVYPVTSNTATTITVSGSMLSDGASIGDSYQIVCNGHRYHLQSWQTGGLNPYNGKKWDSDWSATSDGDMQIDSMISCPTCHNVHGSKYGRMVRDGELISKIYNRRPGLDFYYIPPTTYPNDTKLAESTGGHWSNGCCRMCANCHGSPAATYSRTPVGIVSFSSGADQYFGVSDPPTTISTLTITDNPQAGSITAANDIRIRIPDNLNMTWDTTDVSTTMGGSASGNVDSTVSFPDNKTLLIDVTGNFSAGDTLIIDDLSFTNFTAISDPNNLELYIDGGHILCAEDSKTILIGTKAIISSADNQVFAVGDWSTEVSPITVLAITDDADVNTTNDIRIRIPSTFPMVWDMGDTSADITGGAAGNVNSTVSFPDERTLLIDVLADFNEGDGITISGLNFMNFYDVASADNLELYVDGASDTTADALDDKTIVIESESWMSPVDIKRGYCSEEMSCYDTLIDGDLTTGNLWSGRNGIFDLGREYLVTHIRIYAQYDNKWRVYVGNTLTDCLSDGTDVTGLWRIGHDGTRWYEMAVTQASGRYLRLKWENVGGYPGDNTLMEIEFFGIPIDGSGLRITSDIDQEFEVGQAATAVSQITITEGSLPAITVSNDIRIMIPSSLYMSWDTSDTEATIGGTASGKVNTTVSFPDDKTLLIDVTSDFAASDTLTIEGLSFKDFLGQSEVANLQLSVDGGSTFSTTDPKTKRIWDWITPIDVVEASPDCCDLNSAGFLIDNDTATGNTPWTGGYALVDLGDTYTVTALRIYTVSSYDYWDVSIGSNTTDCTLNSYGTKVKDEWYVNGDGWSYVEINPPVSGRYIRIDKDQGGGLNERGLREIDFQGYKVTESSHMTMVSFADQTFEKDQATTPIQPISIKYHPSNGPITATNDIRIKIPASFNMTWDTTDTASTIGGSAATKVNNTVSYPDSKTLLINVTQDFIAGDTLSISALSFTNFSDQSFKDHLELSVDGGTTVAATDSKYISIFHWQTPGIYTTDCTSCCGAANVVDGNTATGNCTWGGPIIFDLGSTKTVRQIRVWANGSRRWTARVGDDPTPSCIAWCDPADCCGCSWPAPRWNWYPINGQWSETPVIPTDGRYIKFYVDVGGPVGANTIMEFQYQAW
jgi:hypothetical protein